MSLSQAKEETKLLKNYPKTVQFHQLRIKKKEMKRKTPNARERNLL